MVKCGINENVAKNLIFMDGIARSGKSLFSGIITSLEYFEHIQFYNLLELVVPAIELGFLDSEYGKAQLRTHMNGLVYSMLLSRGVNFRYDDQSGVMNYKEPMIYYQRLAKKEVDNSVVEELRQGKRFFMFQTHDLLVNFKQLEKLELDFNMLEIFRHPVDNCYSWWKRGLGERFGKDPRLLTLCINHKGELLPWYSVGFEDEWLRLNPMERCVRTATNLINKAVLEYKNTVNKDRIHLLTFEDFVQNPVEELSKICSFIGTNTTDFTPYFIKKANCPRILDPKERQRKFNELSSNTDMKLSDLLAKMSESYEKDVYGLRSYMRG